MGDALWWTLQTATTSTFGSNATTTEGRIIGGIIMLVGIGITGVPCFRVGKIENVIDFRKGGKNNIKAEIGKG